MKHLAPFVATLLLIAAIPAIEAIIYDRYCIVFREDYNFDIHRYAGKWYEIRRLYDPEDVELDDCVQELYTPRKPPNNTVITFDVVRAVQQGPTGQVIYSKGRVGAKSAPHTEIPKFIYRYNTTSPADPDLDMDIVLTDYQNFAVVYACNRVNDSAKSQFAWVYSRTPVLSKDIADKVNNFIERKFDHPKHHWRTTEQSSKICKPNTLPEYRSAATTVGIQFWSSLMSLVVACLLARIAMLC